MKRYVMFGTHPLFGDFVDAIHACGGILTRVVRNVEEPPRVPGQRFEDRLDNYHAWLERQGIRHRVEVLMLCDFRPQAGEEFLFGFRGPKLLPLREDLRMRFGLSFTVIVHPGAYVSPMARLEEGVFVGAGSLIGTNVRIDEFTFINRGAIIEHDCNVGPCVIVGPSAAVASSVRIGAGAILGIGATVLEKLSIGEDSYVAGGAVVLKDVPPHVMVAGVPAVEKKAFFRK